MTAALLTIILFGSAAEKLHNNCVNIVSGKQAHNNCINIGSAQRKHINCVNIGSAQQKQGVLVVLGKTCSVFDFLVR